MTSEPLSIRSTFGGPPATANTRLSSAMSRSAGIERSTIFSSGSRVCSSIIEAILMALPPMVESNWIRAHSTSATSASTSG